MNVFTKCLIILLRWRNELFGNLFSKAFHIGDVSSWRCRHSLWRCVTLPFQLHKLLRMLFKTVIAVLKEQVVLKVWIIYWTQFGIFELLGVQDLSITIIGVFVRVIKLVLFFWPLSFWIVFRVSDLVWLFSRPSALNGKRLDFSWVPRARCSSLVIAPIFWNLLPWVFRAAEVTLLALQH